MSKCQDCKKEMLTASSCKKEFKYLEIDGKIYLRNTGYFDDGDRCGDCGIINAPGNIHHWGCDMERCPKCEGQLISCGCKEIRLLECVKGQEFKLNIK